MSDTFKTQDRGALLGGDRYLALLATALLGYALMGKGFAYLGFPHRGRRLSAERRIGRLACDSA